MAPPPSENLCLMPSWSSEAVMAPPSRSVKLENSTLYSGGWFHIYRAAPMAIRAATPRPRRKFLPIGVLAKACTDSTGVRAAAGGGWFSSMSSATAMMSFRALVFAGGWVAASDGGGGDSQDYPPLSRASIAQIEGAFAACSAERLALTLVLWNPGNTW